MTLLIQFSTSVTLLIIGVFFIILGFYLKYKPVNNEPILQKIKQGNEKKNTPIVTNISQAIKNKIPLKQTS